MTETKITLPDGRKAVVRVRSPESYTPNPDNTNQGTERGTAALESSLQQTGLHRGIVVAADDTVVNGNHAFMTAEQLGVAKAWVEIEVEGDVGIVTKRVDWESAKDPKAILAAIADNRTSELNYSPSPEDLKYALSVLDEFDIKIPDVLFTENELEGAIAQLDPEDNESEDQSAALKDQFQVLVTCQSEAEQSQVLEKLMEDGHQCRALIS